MIAYVDRRLPQEVRRHIGPEDVVQEVCVAAMRGLPKYRPQGPGSFDRWLMTLMNRRLIDIIRSGRAQKRGDRHQRLSSRILINGSMLRVFDTIGNADRTPSRVLSSREKIRAVRLALASLPDPYRTVLRLRHIEGRSAIEVAETLNRSESSVRGILRRGSVMLRKEIGKASNYISDTDSVADRHYVN